MMAEDIMAGTARGSREKTEPNSLTILVPVADAGGSIFIRNTSNRFSCSSGEAEHAVNHSSEQHRV